LEERAKKKARGEVRDKKINRPISLGKRRALEESKC